MRVSKWEMAIALTFGLCAFCVIFFKMYVPIVGTHIVMDPSELFVTHCWQQFLLWLLGITLYYYLFIIFIFSLINFFLNHDFYVQAFGGETAFWSLYGIIAKAAFPEILLTLFITTAVLFFLPPRYRKEQV